MARHIHEVQVFRTDELHRRTLEEAVVFFADICGVVDSLPSDLMDVGSSANDADCGIFRRQLRSEQSNPVAAGVHDRTTQWTYRSPECVKPVSPCQHLSYLTQPRQRKARTS